MALEHSAALLVASALAAACSFNGFGTPGAVETVVTTDNGATTVQRRAHGLHVYADGAFGVHLGSVSRYLVYPGSRVNTSCGDALTGAPTDAAAARRAEPVVLASVSKGVGLEVTPIAVAAGIGVRARRVVRLRSGGDAVLRVRNGRFVEPGDICSWIAGGGHG